MTAIFKYLSIQKSIYLRIKRPLFLLSKICILDIITKKGIHFIQLGDSQLHGASK